MGSSLDVLIGFDLFNKDFEHSCKAAELAEWVEEDETGAER